MKKTKWIGVGSPWCEDEVACHIIHALEQYHQSHPNNVEVSFEYLDRPGVQLLRAMQGFKRVYVIDAMHSDRELGTIERFKAKDLIAYTPVESISTHHMGVLEVIALGDTLQTLPSELIVYGIEIGNATMQSEWSLPLEPVIQKMIQVFKIECVSQNRDG